VAVDIEKPGVMTRRVIALRNGTATDGLPPLTVGEISLEVGLPTDVVAAIIANARRSGVAIAGPIDAGPTSERRRVSRIVRVWNGDGGGHGALPSLTELARRFGVSRHAITKTLVVAERLGLEVRRGGREDAARECRLSEDERRARVLTVLRVWRDHPLGRRLTAARSLGMPFERYRAILIDGLVLAVDGFLDAAVKAEAEGALASLVPIRRRRVDVWAERKREVLRLWNTPQGDRYLTQRAIAEAIGIRPTSVARVLALAREGGETVRWGISFRRLGVLGPIAVEPDGVSVRDRFRGQRQEVVRLWNSKDDGRYLTMPEIAERRGLSSNAVSTIIVRARKMDPGVRYARADCLRSADL
jgi:hypothetical protein